MTKMYCQSLAFSLNPPDAWRPAKYDKSFHSEINTKITDKRFNNYYRYTGTVYIFVQRQTDYDKL